MQLTAAQTIVWYSGFALELLVCFFAIRRKLFREFPIFTAYLFLVSARSALVFALYHASGYASWTAFYFYWLTQALQLCMRAAAIGEMAWVVSRPYPGFRVLLKWVMPAIALALLLRAGFCGGSQDGVLAGFCGHRGTRAGVDRRAGALRLLGA